MVENEETFTEEDKEIAKYLGIGLIEIRDRNAGYDCYEVLEAPANVPLAKCLDNLLKAFGLPQFCSTKVK